MPSNGYDISRGTAKRDTVRSFRAKKGGKGARVDDFEYKYNATEGRRWDSDRWQEERRSAKMNRGDWGCDKRGYRIDPTYDDISDSEARELRFENVPRVDRDSFDSLHDDRDDSDPCEHNTSRSSACDNTQHSSQLDGDNITTKSCSSEGSNQHYETGSPYVATPPTTKRGLNVAAKEFIPGMGWVKSEPIEHPLSSMVDESYCQPRPLPCQPYGMYNEGPPVIASHDARPVPQRSFPYNSPLGCPPPMMDSSDPLPPHLAAAFDFPFPAAPAEVKKADVYVKPAGRAEKEMERTPQVTPHKTFETRRRSSSLTNSTPVREAKPAATPPSTSSAAPLLLERDQMLSWADVTEEEDAMEFPPCPP